MEETDIKLQLLNKGVISITSFLETLGIDYDTEMNKMVEEKKHFYALNPDQVENVIEETIDQDELSKFGELESTYRFIDV